MTRSEPRERMWRRGPDGQLVRAIPAPEAGARDAAGDAGRAPAATRRARWVVALRLGLRDIYDYLGMVLVISALGVAVGVLALAGGQAVGVALLGALPGFLPAAAGVLAALVALAVIGGPLAAGFCRWARNAAARSEPEVFDLAWGFRAVWGRSVGLALVQGLGTLLLAGNAAFYLSQRHPLLTLLSAVFGYAWFFWLLMAMYQWPLLAEQELSVAQALKKSALLVLDNPGYSLALAVALLLLTILCWTTVLGGVLLWIGAATVLLTQATRELLRKYDLLPPDPTLDPIADETNARG